MKTIFAIAFLIILNSTLFAQQKTEAYFGVSGRNDASSDILEMYDNGYYISGGFKTGNDNYNGWNIKTDINLEMIYDKVLEHSISTVAISSSVSDNNGNIYISGFTNYPDIWPFITKLDSCGNKLWCKILIYDEDFNYGWSNDIIMSNNNEVVILTTSVSDDQIDMTHLIGLSGNGDVLWKKPYASRNNYSWIRQPIGYSIKEINNDYYISGDCYWPYPDDTTHWFLRPLFIGIDSLFNEKWILPFYPLDSIYGAAFKTVPLNDSIFMGAGIRRAYDSSNEDVAFLMFYNNNGEELGFAHIDNDQLGEDVKGSDIRDIARINDTLFMTASLFGPDFGGNPGGEFIVSINGDVYASNSRPDTHIPKLIKTSDNNYVIATSIEENKGDDDIYVYKIDENLNDVPFDPAPHNYDSLCPGGIQSGNIDLSDCFIWTNIGDAPSPQEYYASIKQIPIRAYPNPATKGNITFEFENTEYHNNIVLKCFDLYGKAIFTKKVYRYQTETVVDITELKQGMYVAVVYSDGFPVGECKFVIQ